MAGISFLIGDEQLVLSAKQKITISVESPLLSDKTIPGAVSFPFDIPNTPYNRRLLNVSETLMSFNENQNVKCKCFLGGNFWKSGFLIINNQRQLNVTFTEFNSIEDFEETTLQELAFPNHDTSQKFYDFQTLEKSEFHLELIYRALGTYTEKDFVCPVVFNSKVADIAAGSFSFQNCYANNSYASGYYSEIAMNAISPMLYVNYVLKYLFKYFGISIKTNKLSESDYDNLILYTNRTNVLIARNSLVGTENYDYYFEEPTINLNEYVPSSSLLDFLTGLKKAFNLFFNINWLDNNVSILSKIDMIKSAKVIDISSITEPFDGLTFNKQEKKVTAIVYAKQGDAIITDDPTKMSLKGYNYLGVLPDMNFPTSDYKNFDYYIINESAVNTVDIKKIYFYEDGTWKSLFEKITAEGKRPYDVYFVSNTKKENKLEIGIDTVVTRNNQTAILGTTMDYYRYFSPAVDMSLATNAGWFNPNDGTGLQHIGKTDVEVSSGIRLLFYRGMRQEMFDGGQYPYANRNEFDFTIQNPGAPNVDNTPFITRPIFFENFNKSLEIDGPKGLWELHHRDWQNFLLTFSRLATYNIRFSAAQLMKGDIYINYLQINGNRFIISKLTITADANTIYPCKTEMYQVEPK